MKIKAKMKNKSHQESKAGVMPVSEEMPKKKKAYDSLDAAKKKYTK